MNSVKLFFDFEFDPATKAPISFGIVGNLKDSGLECSLYCEFKIALDKVKSIFVHDTVAPLLGLPEGQRKISNGEFGGMLTEAITQLCKISDVRTSEIVLICDSECDKDIFHRLAGNLFEVELVKFQNFEEERDYEESYADYFDDIAFPRHHALYDANALMQAYFTITKSRNAQKVAFNG